MMRIQGWPISSTPVRIWRASGWKTSPWRDQSRGPAGPETMAYIASTTAPMAALSSAVIASRRSRLVSARSPPRSPAVNGPGAGVRAMGCGRMERAIRIDDPADPRLGDYREVRERDVVGRGGGFIAESVVVLEKLLAAGRHPVASVLVEEHRLERLAPLLAKVPPGVPVFAAAQPVMDRLAGFHIHRGVLAAGRRAEPAADTLIGSLPARSLAVGLVGVANHDNMGG